MTFDGSKFGAGCPAAGTCNVHTVPVPLGGTALYTFALENHGPSTATNVVLTITFPPNTTIDHFIATNTNCSSSVVARVPTLSCTTASLPVGALVGEAVFLVVNSNYSSSTLIANAAVTSTTTDPILTNNTASVTLPVLLTIPTLGAASLAMLACALAAVALVALRRF